MSESDSQPGEGDDPSDGEADKPAAERAPVRPPREELYLALWNAYRDGVRHKQTLKRKFQCGWLVVNEAVERGWPEMGWASLRSRFELWERQKDAERRKESARLDAKAAQRKGRDEAQTWSTFKPRAVRVLLEGYDALEALAVKLREVSKVASFVRYRQIRERDPVTGKVTTTDQAFVDGLQVAQAVRLWAGAVREAGSLMSLVTGGPKEASGTITLTPEQLAQLREGQLPEGVSVEQVAQAILALGGGGGGE